MAAAWSSLGLITAALGKSVCIIDPTIPFSDPLYYKKVAEKDASLMCFSSLGSHLALVDSEGNIDIYAFKFPGRLDSLKLIYTHLNDDIRSMPVAMTWCENRRVFSWNSTGLSNGSNAASSNSASNTAPASCFISRNYQVDFLPIGHLGLVILCSDGKVKILRQSLKSAVVDTSQSTFECIDLILSDLESSDPVLSSSIVMQKSSGIVIILLRQASNLSQYKLSADTQFTATLSYRIRLALPDLIHERFVWYDSREQLAHLVLESTKQPDTSNFVLQHYNLELQPIQGTAKATPVPASFRSIVHSQRAAGYFLTNSDRSDEVLMLNLSGDFARSLRLDHSSLVWNPATSTSFSPLLISPNGLCICRLVTFGAIPLCLYATVGELSHKSLPVLREFAGKMISSAINGIDNWDIVQPLRKTVLSLISSEKKERGPEAAMTFLSAFLSEWLSLLSAASIPSTEFYGKLLDCFRILSVDQVFESAYQATDLVISLKAAEKIVKRIVDKTDADFSSSITFVPVLISAFEKIRLTVIDDISGSSKTFHGLGLLMLDEEFFSVVTALLTAAEQVMLQIQLLINTPNQRPQSLIIFYTENMLSLESSLISLAPWASANNGKSGSLAFLTFLQALRSDPQLLTKRSTGIFTFLTDFLLDTVNQDRIWSHMKRIWSRFSGDENGSTTHLDNLLCVPLEKSLCIFEAIRGINVPLNKVKSDVILCRRCCRVLLQPKAGSRPSRIENVYSSDWSDSLFTTRCPCGSSRHLIN